MNPTIRNILALLAGAIAGSMVNWLIISVGSKLIPLPDGTNFDTVEAIQAAMPLLETKHFIMPWLAHALGTFVGAWLTVKLAVKKELILAMIIGGLFFAGGLQMIFSLSAPMWFNLVDLMLAYFPMAYLGWKIGSKKAIS